MEKFKIEDGDIELLAMGLLDQEREQAVLALLEKNEELNLEYIKVQEALAVIANENKLEAPSDIYFKTKAAIFEKKEAKAIPFYKTKTFSVAASVLLVCSLLANFFLFKKDLSQSTSTLSEEEKFLADLPMSTTTLDEMFVFLHDGLEKEPCSGEYKLTKEFVAANNLNEQDVLSFCREHHGHCDCEVLINVSLSAPKEIYIHGTMPKQRPSNIDLRLGAIIDRSTHHIHKHITPPITFIQRRF